MSCCCFRSGLSPLHLWEPAAEEGERAAVAVAVEVEEVGRTSTR